MKRLLISLAALAVLFLAGCAERSVTTTTEETTIHRPVSTTTTETTRSY